MPASATRVGRRAAIPALALVLGWLGCGAGRNPPALGVRAGQGAFGREVVIELEASLSNRILDLQAEGADRLLLLTSERAISRSLGAAAAERIVPFSERDFLFPARMVEGSVGFEVSFVGMSSSGGCVLLLDGAGSRVGCYPASPSGEFAVADLAGDEEDEVVVETPDGRGIAVYERSGRRLWDFDAGGYVTALAAAGAAAGAKAELILHVYPGRAGRGSGTYLVVSGDGRLEHEWNGSPVGDVEPTPWGGRTASFLTLEDDAVAVTSPAGERIQTMAVPGAGRFRDLRAVELATGHRVVLAKGGGYWPYHMVAVLTADGDLIYHEVGEERAYGLAAPPWAEGSFFVSVDHRVLRYSFRP